MADEQHPGRDPAERRLWIMTLARLAAFAVVLLGFWIVGTAGADLKRTALGLVVILGGLLLFLFGPRALNRHWRR
jgi:small neutral amino acid transporter SnatA (MarC family)